MSFIVKAVKSVLSIFRPAKAPNVKAPAVMPTPNDDDSFAARRKRLTEMQGRGGRASTIFTGQDDKLGG